MRSIADAEKVVALVGFRYGDGGYKKALEIAMRGWPAFRIAQHYNLSADLIYKLGGPEPPVVSSLGKDSKP